MMKKKVIKKAHHKMAPSYSPTHLRIGRKRLLTGAQNFLDGASWTSSDSLHPNVSTLAVAREVAVSGLEVEEIGLVGKPERLEV